MENQIIFLNLEQTKSMETNQQLAAKEEFYHRFKKIELIVSAIAVVAVSAKISGLHFPGLSPILIVSIGSSMMFTGLFAFSGTTIYENKKPVLVTIACLACSLLMVGTLFSIMFWPGTRMFIIVGLSLSMLALIWIAAGLGENIFSLTSIYNRALLLKIVFFGSIAAWALSSPVELYKHASVYGKDPIAVRLYEAHIKDPQNSAKTQAFYEYTKSKRKKNH